MKQAVVATLRVTVEYELSKHFSGLYFAAWRGTPYATSVSQRVTPAPTGVQDELDAIRVRQRALNSVRKKSYNSDAANQSVTLRGKIFIHPLVKDDVYWFVLDFAGYPKLRKLLFLFRISIPNVLQGDGQASGNILLR